MSVVVPVPAVVPAALADLHRALGLPADYAQRRGLTFQAEAPSASLVTIAHTDDGRAIQLSPPAAAAWTRLKCAAEADTVALIPISGFRSIARQTEIIRGHLAAGRSLDAILRLVAAPGYSEHHTGHAVDLTTPDDPPLEAGFALTPAFTWLTLHATRFGFHLSFPQHNPHGIAYEPWHWCWRPADQTT
jgi:D-alanyl-D-alanine carboxypeptidase